MAQERYTLVRVYYKIIEFDSKLRTEKIGCKRLQEAVSLGSCLSEEEKQLGSYIFDNVTQKKLTLQGKREDKERIDFVKSRLAWLVLQEYST